MRLSLSGLVTVGVVLAVAGAVARVIALLIILTGLVTILTRPREMIALVTALGVLNLVALFPLPALGIVGGLVACRLTSLKHASFWRMGRRDDHPH
jgi:hypothetical protein